MTQVATRANVGAEQLIPQAAEDRSKFLDFETSKVQLITLDQLAKTKREDDITGKPLRGIYHFDLIEQITDAARQKGYDVEIYDMFAAHNRDRTQPGVVRLPDLERIYGDKAVEAHVLRRVFANIRLKDFDNDELTTNLAVSFHQKGIEVGFGNMVKICHNQCMLGTNGAGAHYASTYSGKGRGKYGERYEIEQILDIVRSWFVDARHKVVEERERMDKMKQLVVPEKQCLELIGRMSAMRVACDTAVKRIKNFQQYPLNQAQITKFTEAMLCAYHDSDRVSVWDIYNAATEMYKPGQTDVPSLLTQNMAMTQLLAENFEI